MLKLLFCIAAALAPACAWSQSLHTAPPGTIVEGAFVLANKTVPLPPGKFTLVSAQQRASRASTVGTGVQIRETAPVAEVLLVQADGGRLRAMVWAKTNADGGSRWVNEPCKRTDTLFRLDRAKSVNYLQDCVLVNHFVGVLSKPGGMLTGAYDALKAQAVEVPIKTMLEAAVTRIDQREYLEVLYRVNPEAFGFAADTGVNWATSDWHPSRMAKDPRREAFARSFTDWAVALEPAFERGFRGKDVPAGLVPPLALSPRT